MNRRRRKRSIAFKIPATKEMYLSSSVRIPPRAFALTMVALDELGVVGFPERLTEARVERDSRLTGFSTLGASALEVSSLGNEVILDLAAASGVAVRSTAKEKEVELKSGA